MVGQCFAAVCAVCSVQRTACVGQHIWRKLRRHLQHVTEGKVISIATKITNFQTKVIFFTTEIAFCDVDWTCVQGWFWWLLW